MRRYPSGRWRISAPHCGRRGCARESTSPRSKRAPRSAPSTCAQSRTRNGICSPGRSTSRASCARTVTTSVSTADCSSMSTSGATSVPPTMRCARSRPSRTSASAPPEVRCCRRGRSSALSSWLSWSSCTSSGRPGTTRRLRPLRPAPRPGRRPRTGAGGPAATRRRRNPRPSSSSSCRRAASTCAWSTDRASG